MCLPCCQKTFLGTQPTLTHVPPNRAPSTTRTWSHKPTRQASIPARSVKKQRTKPWLLIAPRGARSRCLRYHPQRPRSPKASTSGSSPLVLRFGARWCMQPRPVYSSSYKRSPKFYTPPWLALLAPCTAACFRTVMYARNSKSGLC
jgi:hypothetical protein